MMIVEYIPQILKSTQGDLKNGDIDTWFPASLRGHWYPMIRSWSAHCRKTFRANFLTVSYHSLENPLDCKRLMSRIHEFFISDILDHRISIALQIKFAYICDTNFF